MNRKLLISNLILLGFKQGPCSFKPYVKGSISIYVHIKTMHIYKLEVKIPPEIYTFSEALPIINELLNNKRN